MATAGHNSRINVGATAAPSTELSGIKSATLNRSVDMLDTTALSDGQFRKRIQGLQDCAMSFTGDYVDADAGQVAVQDNLDSGTDLFVQWLPDGTNGYEWQMSVSRYSLNITVEGLVEWTAELVANDANGSSDVSVP